MAKKTGEIQREIDRSDRETRQSDRARNENRNGRELVKEAQRVRRVHRAWGGDMGGAAQKASRDDPGTPRSSFPRKYNLVLYMCCVYILTYLAWNFHTEPHNLITEHGQVNKHLETFVQPKLSDRIVGNRGGAGAFEDRALTTDAGEAEEVVVTDEGKVPSGHAPKKSKHHHKPPTSEDQQKQVNSRNPSILGALIGESPQSSQAESADKEEGDGDGSDGQVKPSKGRKSRKRRKKHYDVHIAMSKQSIPAKGTRLVSPWKDLRGHCCRDLGRVTDKLISALPDTDLLNDTHYDTCAIVGSAGLLLTQEFGKEIDDHEAIFRFNIAPAKGFEKNVGSRTTLRLINRHHLGFREFKEEICLFHTTVEEALRHYVRIATKHPDLPNVPMDMSFYKKVVEWNKLETPTNGYFGLKLALMLCDKIDIYGFLRTWKGYVKYHYFNDEEPNSRQLSRDTKGEMPIILDLLKSHADKIHFKHPCIVDQECKGCAEGSHCDGHTPYPVPKRGYCQVEGKQCFLECKPPSTCGKGFCSPLMEGYDQCK